MAPPLSARLLAEFIGTFALIFIGAGSVCLDFMTHGPGLVGIALAHGLTIYAMVAAVGHVSGGHFNPAVSVMAAVTKRIAPGLALAYIAAQLIGAVVAAFILRRVFSVGVWGPISLGTCAPNFGLTEFAAFAVETILTFFLVFVILGAAVDPRGSKSGGLAVGATVALDILMGGPLTGAAMNPARWFGPALASGHLVAHKEQIWVYTVGPVLGAVVAALVYDRLICPAAAVKNT